VSKKPRKPVARRQRSAAARLRPFWILLVLFAAVFILGGYYVLTWPGFRARQVVVIGNHRVPTKEIVARADIHKRFNIWLQNMGAVADRVATIPDIGPVTINRGFPASLTIVVHERYPFAVIRSGGRKVVTDRELRVLTARPASTLPKAGQYIKDERAMRLRDDYEKLTEANVVVVSLAYDRFGDLVAVTPRGIRILLGDDEDLARKVALIGPILSQTGKKKVAAIDLRAPNTPVVTYR
jgi:cell division septal protein FtsQ